MCICFTLSCKMSTGFYEHIFQCMWTVCARVHVFAFIPLFLPAVSHGVSTTSHLSPFTRIALGWPPLCPTTILKLFYVYYFGSCSNLNCWWKRRTSISSITPVHCYYVWLMHVFCCKDLKDKSKINYNSSKELPVETSWAESNPDLSPYYLCNLGKLHLVALCILSMKANNTTYLHGCYEE